MAKNNSTLKELLHTNQRVVVDPHTVTPILNGLNPQYQLLHIKYLAQQIASDKNITHVNFTNSMLSKDELAIILNALITNGNIKSLDLSNNDNLFTDFAICDQKCSELWQQFLANNTTLTHLNISSTDISNNEFYSVIAPLNHSKITALDISSNPVIHPKSYACMDATLPFLYQNTTIEYINLGYQPSIADYDSDQCESAKYFFSILNLINTKPSLALHADGILDGKNEPFYSNLKDIFTQEHLKYALILQAQLLRTTPLPEDVILTVLDYIEYSEWFKPGLPLEEIEPMGNDMEVSFLE